jgi:integrase
MVSNFVTLLGGSDTMRAITPDEVKTLIHACRPTALRDKALIDLMYHSGLRVSEALDLRRSDIDGNRVTVRHGKGGKKRTVALVTSYGWLELWVAQCGARGEDYIFTTRAGKRLATSHVRRLLNRLGDKTGIQTHPHGLRHGHAVALYEAGLDLAGISRQLGHARISTTAVYLQGLGVDLDKVAALTF